MLSVSDVFQRRFFLRCGDRMTAMPKVLLTKVISVMITTGQGLVMDLATIWLSSCFWIHFLLWPYSSANCSSVCRFQIYFFQRTFCKDDLRTFARNRNPQLLQKYLCLFLARPYFFVFWDLHFGQNRAFFYSHSLNYLRFMAIVWHKMQFSALQIYN